MLKNTLFVFALLLGIVIANPAGTNAAIIKNDNQESVIGKIQKNKIHFRKLKIPRLPLLKLPARKVALRAWNGKYVSADGNRNFHLVADRGQIGDWEIFEMQYFSQNQVALKAWNRKYVSVDHSNHNKLVSHSKTMTQIERFKVIKHNNNRISLQTLDGKLVCADRNKNMDLYADRLQAGEWEKFSIIDKEDARANKLSLNKKLFLEKVTAPVIPGFDQQWDKATHAFETQNLQRFNMILKNKMVKNRYREPLNLNNSPIITNLTTTTNHGSNILVPNNYFLAEGKNFGSIRGTIQLTLSEKVNGISIIPIDTKSIQWTNTLVAAKLLPMNRLNKPAKGVLLVTPAGNHKLPARFPVVINPELEIRQVSGRKFFHPAANDRQHMQIREFDNGKFLAVIHDPACGIIGDDGIDTFSFNLPVGCAVKKILFAPQIPSNTSLARNWLERNLAGIISSFAKGGLAGLVKYGGAILLEYLASKISPGAGKYGAWALTPEAKNLSAFQILWHNTCFSTYDDIPIIYVVSFFVSCPVGQSL